MRRVIHKIFPIWSFDKEERWLNDMAAQGWALDDVGFCRYEFESCEPGEYVIGLEMLEERLNHPKSQDYLGFLKETGVELVGALFRWVYLRSLSNADNVLFSDTDSLIRHMDRVIALPGMLTIATMLMIPNQVTNFLDDRDISSLIVMMLSVGVTLLMAYAFVRIYVKRQKLKKERVLHE
jgi:uncharacterized protein YacL